jgi:hypothetical protein
MDVGHGIIDGKKVLMGRRIMYLDTKLSIMLDAWWIVGWKIGLGNKIDATRDISILVFIESSNFHLRDSSLRQFIVGLDSIAPQ